MTDAPTTIPTTPGTELSKDQFVVERLSIERAERRARNLLFGNIALLTSLTATQGFIDPPYFLRGLLWTSLAFCIISAVFCGLFIHDTDRRLNNLDLSAKKQRRRNINLFDEIAFWTFAGTFIFLVAFIFVNLVESLRTDRNTVDIKASKYIVEPGEVVALEVDGSEGEEFIWATSSGVLLDDNERSVTWIAPEGADDGGEDLIEVKVCVRRNHIFFCETDKIIVLSNNANKRAVFPRNDSGASGLLREISEINTDSLCSSGLFPETIETLLQSQLNQVETPVPPLIPGLPCCSTKIIKINCDWNC